MNTNPLIGQTIGNYAVRMEPAAPRDPIAEFLQSQPTVRKSGPFALDPDDDTPLPVICDLQDGTCEACQ